MLRKFQQYLTQLDYPNINHMSEEDITNIFDPGNRTFLLSWILEHIDPCTTNVLKSKEPKQVQCLIADFVYEYGFCTFSQKEMFVKGDPGMMVLEQVMIINKMLLFLVELKKTHTTVVTTDVVDDSLSLSALDSYINLDINMFPTLGTIKHRTANERQKELVKYQNEYELLKDKIVGLKDLEHENEENCANQNNEQDYYDNLNKLESLSSDLHTKLAVLTCQNKQSNDDKYMQMDEKWLSNAANNISYFAKSLNSINTIVVASTNNEEKKHISTNTKESDECFEVFSEIKTAIGV